MNTHTIADREKHSARGGRWGRACLLGALLIAPGGLARAQGGHAPKFHEYEVKAAFLLNFMQFVEWPNGATNNHSATPLLIGVLGEDPFGATLDETTKGETIHGRPLAIRRQRQIAELKDCQLIFVCRSEKTRLPEILGAVQGSAALTVSDIEQFCRHGGMIGLLNEGSKIRFEINQAAAEQSRLKISSKLLRLGRLTGK